MENAAVILIEFQNEFRHLTVAYSCNHIIDTAIAAVPLGEHRGFAWLVAKAAWFLSL